MQYLINSEIFVVIFMLNVSKMAGDYHWKIIKNDNSSLIEVYLAFVATIVGIYGIFMGIDLYTQVLVSSSNGILDEYILLGYFIRRIVLFFNTQTRQREIP